MMEMLKVFPFWILGVLALAWHGYLYYDFENGETSQKQILNQQLEGVRQNITQIESKILEAKSFEQSLEAKKLELRAKNEELQSMSVVLTSEIDIASFVRLVSSEAKKLGLKIGSIKPSGEQTSNYYAYTRVAIEYEAVFVQLVQFLRVLSETDKINRVSEFNIRIAREQTPRLVPLRGTLYVDVFRYLYTEEDKLVKDVSQNSENIRVVPLNREVSLLLDRDKN